MKILVIDDEADVQPMFLQRFRKEIVSPPKNPTALSGQNCLTVIA
jgi:two-component system chemotaxis response regulator CheY